VIGDPVFAATRARRSSLKNGLLGGVHNIQRLFLADLTTSLFLAGKYLKWKYLNVIRFLDHFPLYINVFKKMQIFYKNVSYGQNIFFNAEIFPQLEIDSWEIKILPPIQNGSVRGNYGK